MQNIQLDLNKIIVFSSLHLAIMFLLFFATDKKIKKLIASLYLTILSLLLRNESLSFISVFVPE